jgi:hypothetical protein
MEINKRDRSELKSYFIKNAIPTESNFAEFIDAVLNQKDDGIVKLPGNPLSIEATGDDTSLKKAINFYQSFTDPKPSWTLSLNPRSDPGKPETARSGFSISDGEGHSRLFIDRSTGKVGIGTTDPAETLELDGRIKSGALTVGVWPPSAGYVFFGTNALDQKAAQNYALLQGSSGSGIGRTYLNSPVDVRFRINNADKMTLANNGNVGIGTTNPGYSLEVAGEMFARDGVLVIGNRNTHLDTDGAFYRYKGQVYITVDDHLYVRDSGGGIKFHFDTNAGLIRQENWKPLPLINSWINYSSTYNPAGYFKDSMGIVHLRGLIKNGAKNHISTLPAGYRPPRRELHGTSTHPNVYARVDVLKDGRVWATKYDKGWLSLDGITFRAA